MRNFTPMRFAFQIPHPVMKISVFLWNGKYIIELEWMSYKQSFKISEEVVSGEKDIQRLCNEDFLNAALNRFAEMHQSFKSTYELSKN